MRENCITRSCTHLTEHVCALCSRNTNGKHSENASALLGKAIFPLSIDKQQVSIPHPTNPPLGGCQGQRICTSSHKKKKYQQRQLEIHGNICSFASWLPAFPPREDV